MKPPAEVNLLINSLTDNEDLRQDLWVFYLSGNSPEAISEHLAKISIEYEDHDNVRQNLWSILKNPPSDGLTSTLETFTDYERSIIFLMLVGCTVDQISQHKGINQVRVRQVLASIRYNSCWDKLYGTKETPNGRRKIRIVGRRD